MQKVRMMQTRYFCYLNHPNTQSSSQFMSLRPRPPSLARGPPAQDEVEPFAAIVEAYGSGEGRLAVIG
jgi:hypothetical protein